jgi:hypothetical protein
MSPLFLLPAILSASGPLRFERHDIDAFPADYQVAVAADMNLDGRLDLVVIASRSNKLAWYENRRP